MAGSYESLDVWQRAHDVVLDSYRASATFPREEMYGITSQLRRAAVSVPTNIVEGKNRGSDGDYGRFLYMARGSCSEVEYLLRLTKDLGFLSQADFLRLDPEVRTVGRMLNGLLRSLQPTSRFSMLAAGGWRLAANLLGG